MRVGFNPKKDKQQLPSDFFHQVIIPVYIPNEEGYFKDGFRILQLCLESLFKTAHPKTYITVVNNGSCKKVVDYLQDLFTQNKIHEIVHTSNIGYVNAMLKGIVGHKFSLITTADADVLFLNNWQLESYRIFQEFPKTGAICPSPSSRMLRFYSYNIFFDKFLSKKMLFSRTKNPNALKAFAKSVGNEKLYKQCHLEKYLTIENQKLKAVVGAGHYVVTYNAHIFDELKKKHTDFALGGGSDDLLDKPVVEKGYWRLSTEDNFAYHMGNVIEPWMEDVVKALEDQSEMELTSPKLNSIKEVKIFNKLKRIFFSKLLSRKPIWQLFLQYKGLSKTEAKHY